MYVNYPLFRYYPLAERFSFSDLKDPMLGPAMSWYGWMGTAVIPALVVAAVVPKSRGACIPNAVFWVLPFIAFIAG